MGLQSCGSLNLGISGLPLGNLGRNDMVLAPWPGTNNTIRGKVVASTKYGPW